MEIVIIICFGIVSLTFLAEIIRNPPWPWRPRHRRPLIDWVFSFIERLLAKGSNKLEKKTDSDYPEEFFKEIK